MTEILGDKDKLSPESSVDLSRAYVHHLTNVKEILGHILLMKHNVDQMSRFVELIRSDIDLTIAIWILDCIFVHFVFFRMETENEVKTDPEPQQNGAEKMENGEGANRDAPSEDLKPGIL